MVYNFTTSTMESLKTVLKLVALSVVLSSFAEPNTVSALKECYFPAIFNFGDSNSDTGGLNSAFPGFLSPPYGETYFREPAGRFSDGRLVIDFIAESFKLPYLNAYLDSLRSAGLINGLNFATAASTIRLPSRIIPGGGFSPFFLDVQVNQFARLKASFHKNTGNHTGEQFKNALYTFDIGQNDLGEGFFANKSWQDVNSSVPDIIDHFSTNFKKLHKISGGKSFWIHNTGPLGCLPYIQANFPAAEKDEAGCAKPFNDVAKHFNHVLKQAVSKLRSDLPSASITYVDLYSVKYALFADPRRHGFELPLVACCGYGGKYNYSDSVGCGETITVNGSRVTVGSCGRDRVRVNWDGIHYTEAANKFMFDQISTGAFSDPPVALKSSCYKSLN